MIREGEMFGSPRAPREARMQRQAGTGKEFVLCAGTEAAKIVTSSWAQVKTGMGRSKRQSYKLRPSPLFWSRR